MLTRILRTTFALAAALVLPLAAWADTPPTLHYTTALTEAYGSQVPYSGTLQLQFSTDGIVNGYYHPEGDIQFIPVTGGRTGDNIWLDIGTKGAIHISGTITNGTITGEAIAYGKRYPYAFTATPTKTPQM